MTLEQLATVDMTLCSPLWLQATVVVEHVPYILLTASPPAPDRRDDGAVDG